MEETWRQSADYLIWDQSHCLNKDNTKGLSTTQNLPPHFSQWQSDILITEKALQREDYISMFPFWQRNTIVSFSYRLSSVSFHLLLSWNALIPSHVQPDASYLLSLDLLIWPRLISDQLVSYTESSAFPFAVKINRLRSTSNVTKQINGFKAETFLSRWDRMWRIAHSVAATGQSIKNKADSDWHTNEKTQSACTLAHFWEGTVVKN